MVTTEGTTYGDEGAKAIVANATNFFFSEGNDLTAH
jgi:hypothetical protein